MVNVSKHAKKLEVLVLNPIAQVGLKRLPSERFEVVKESRAPDVILVRSADMHGMKFDAKLKAVGRAGAGVNNIPVKELSKLGVPVFNAPGANANAVKELVVAGMLIAARNLGPALDFVRNLDTKDKELEKKVEAGKKAYAGVELPGQATHVASGPRSASAVAPGSRGEPAQARLVALLRRPHAADRAMAFQLHHAELIRALQEGLIQGRVLERKWHVHPGSIFPVD